MRTYDLPFIEQALCPQSYGETRAEQPGAPNENIVQNHLNIALFNVF